MICPICGSLLDLSNNTTKKIQLGGKIANNIINEILNDTFDYETNKETLVELLNSTIMEKLDDEKKLEVINKIKDYYNNVNKKENIEETMPHLFKLCNKCGFNDEIKSGTILYSKTLKNNFSSNININKDITNDSTLLITTNYICPNKNCETYNDPSIKEANMTHYDGKLIYICRICKTIWN